MFYSTWEMTREPKGGWEGGGKGRGRDLVLIHGKFVDPVGVSDQYRTQRLWPSLRSSYPALRQGRLSSDRSRSALGKSPFSFLSLGNTR